MSLISPLFVYFLCWRKIIFLALSFQKLGRNGWSSVCSFHWCYLITRMRNKSDGICYRGCSVGTFYFVPYNLLSVKKPTTNQTPTKTDCELKKLPYFGSGLSFYLNYLTSGEWDPSNQCMRAEFPIGLQNGLARKKIPLSKRKKCEW